MTKEQLKNSVTKIIRANIKYDKALISAINETIDEMSYAEFNKTFNADSKPKKDAKKFNPSYLHTYTSPHLL